MKKNIKKTAGANDGQAKSPERTLDMSNNIILAQYNNKVTADSLMVAKHFGKRHADVIRSVESLISSTQNCVQFFFENSYIDSSGKTNKSYLMTRDGFTLLVMGFTGKAALEWKLKYIKAFNDMERSLLDGSPSYRIADPIERAKAWIKEQEEKKELAEQINQLAPKALFADAVSASSTSILVGELAKLLHQNGIEIGQNRLFDWLRRNGFLMNRFGQRNFPTQKAMEMGLFEIKETSFTHSDGRSEVKVTPKVTGKGQVYFIQKFLGGEAV